MKFRLSRYGIGLGRSPENKSNDMRVLDSRGNDGHFTRGLAFFMVGLFSCEDTSTSKLTPTQTTETTKAPISTPSAASTSIAATTSEPAKPTPGAALDVNEPPSAAPPPQNKESAKLHSIGGGGTDEGTLSICGGCEHGKIGKGGGGGDGSGFGPKGTLPIKPQNPTASDGTASISGGIDKDVVRRVIRRAMPSIKFCYEQGLASKPNLSGKVVIDFTIATSGAVTSATATKGIDPEVDSCIVAKIAKLGFPAPSSEAKVVYPFTFSNTQ
jgi:outer membrane biosynthesis protein TonB